MEKFYITSAITYTSGKPHIGNTYEVILCDAIARQKRMEGYDVFYQTGTDEHGQKVETKAGEIGVTPRKFVDDVSAEIKRIWDLMDVSYDKFIRTTDAYHEEQVAAMFEKFYKKGDIYKSCYEGMYCLPCESFWTAAQLKDGKCPDCGREVKPAKEEAYFFAMGKYAPALVEHILTHPQFIQPAARKREMMNNFLLADEFIGKSDAEILSAARDGSLKCKLQDLCVSRTTFKWGIPVNFDKGHVVYVWLDALTNYITGIGYKTEGSAESYKKYWPADVHVVGKDIMRFHTIYWPIFLMSLGEPLPKTVFGHTWLLQGGDKMSKSRGNVMYADDLASIYGVDAVRYFVLHEMPYSSDGVITWELMTERVNSDLANTLGNLVKRTVTMTNKYFGGRVTKGELQGEFDNDLALIASSVRDKVRERMDEYRISDALDELFALFRRANKYIDETCPWILAKDQKDARRLETVLYNLLEAVCIGAHLLRPFMPSSAQKILREIGAEERSYEDLSAFGASQSFTVTGEPEILFARLNHADIVPAIEAIAAAQMAESGKKDGENLSAPAQNEDENQGEKVNEEGEDMITIDDFAKVKMQVGLVTACEAVKKSKLLHETIKVGDRTISVLSGIGKQYTAEEMVGKKVIVVTNLPPREMKGFISEGMIVCAEAPDGTLSLVSPEKDVPDGSPLS